MAEKNKFSTKYFLDFSEKDRSYIEKLDLFFNEYNQFIEMRHIAGKDKYFIELDLDNLINEAS